MRTLTHKKIIKINFFEIMKINHVLATIDEHLLKKKCLTLKKSNKLCGFLTCPISFSFSPAPIPRKLSFQSSMCVHAGAG